MAAVPVSVALGVVAASPSAARAAGARVRYWPVALDAGVLANQSYSLGLGSSVAGTGRQLSDGLTGSYGYTRAVPDTVNAINESAAADHRYRLAGAEPGFVIGRVDLGIVARRIITGGAVGVGTARFLIDGAPLGATFTASATATTYTASFPLDPASGLGWASLISRGFGFRLTADTVDIAQTEMRVLEFWLDVWEAVAAPDLSLRVVAPGPILRAALAPAVDLSLRVVAPSLSSQTQLTVPPVDLSLRVVAAAPSAVSAVVVPPALALSARVPTTGLGAVQVAAVPPALALAVVAAAPVLGQRALVQPPALALAVVAGTPALGHAAAVQPPALALRAGATTANYSALGPVRVFEQGGVDRAPVETVRRVDVRVDTAFAHGAEDGVRRNSVETGGVDAGPAAADLER